MIRSALAGGLVLGWLACAGCAGYRLGPSNGMVAGAQSMQINLFQNQTMEPRLSEPLAFAMRRLMQQDGTYRLNTHGDADVIVTGVILDFHRSELSFRPEDILTARDYALHLTAQVTATEKLSGKVLLDRRVAGRTTIRVGNDLVSVERQALPLLAEELARNITSALVEGDW